MDKKNSLPFEIKTFPLTCQISDEGLIEAMPAVFEIEDEYRDVIHKGAFKKTIQESKGIVPIYAIHFGDQIGWNLFAEERDEGLFVKGQLDLEVQAAREKFSLVKKALALGVKVGASFGFKPVPGKVEYKSGVRHIRELRWYEWSLATMMPVNPLAKILAVKSSFLIDALPIEGAAHDNIDPEIVQSVRKLTDKIRGNRQ